MMDLSILQNNGFGWIPDEDDPRDWSLDRLALGESLPDAVSMREYVQEIFSQGSSSTCVGQAFIAATHILENRAGLSVMNASRLFLYYNSRRLHDAQGVDAGTSIRRAAKALTRFGVPEERYWPWSTDKTDINSHPSWEAYMRAHPRAGGVYYRINEQGDGRILQLRQALSERLPVVFGLHVDEAFRDKGGDYIVDSMDPNTLIGGHAMLVTGYSWSPHHGFLFEVLNSWGKNFRSGGFLWFSEKLMREITTRDFTVVMAWKRLQ